MILEFEHAKKVIKATYSTAKHTLGRWVSRPPGVMGDTFPNHNNHHS